jgi:hypothetical protein
MKVFLCSDKQNSEPIFISFYLSQHGWSGFFSFFFFAKQQKPTLHRSSPPRRKKKTSHEKIIKQEFSFHEPKPKGCIEFSTLFSKLFTFPIMTRDKIKS